MRYTPAMSTAFRLLVWTRYFASVEAVWSLKTDPVALADEFRPYVFFHMKKTDEFSTAMAQGQPFAAEARLMPWGIRWPMKMEEVVPHVRFRDTSSNRLYKNFEHVHLFEETSDGCRYIDQVTFTPALPANKLIAIFTKRLFEHRHRVAAGRLSADRRTIGVSVLRTLEV